ncbi:hypothetical protein [Sideroxyarcus sp. TK5]
MMRSTTTVRTLAAFCALHLTLLANTVWADSSNLRFFDDFSKPSGWARDTERDKVAEENGVLRIERKDTNKKTEITKPVSVTPAAAWRVSLDVRFAAYAKDDVNVRAGFSITGALGDSIEIVIDREGDVLFTHFNGKDWVKPNPVHFAKATAARLEDNAINTLVVEREAGYFRIFVNGVFVARTRIIDLTPRFVGVIAESFKPAVEELDNLKLEEIGKDSRYVRLLNIVGTPGTQELLVDKFDNDDNWLITDTDEYSSKVSGGRYLVTGKTDDDYGLIGATSLGGIGRSNLPFGFQVSTRVTNLGEIVKPHGIAIFGSEKKGQTTPFLALWVTDKLMRLVNQKPDGHMDAVTPWIETPSLRADGDNWLNMSVLADGRVLVFVNFDYQTTVQMPDWYEPRNLCCVGISFFGPQSLAFDNFYAREF